MKLTVTGSRNWTNRTVLWAHLDRLDPTRISHGVCRGADLIADAWAQTRGIPVEPFPADWHPEGRLDRDRWAGPRRNRVMFRSFGPDLVVAFKDDFDFSLSKGGTEDMVKVALRGGVTVQVVNSVGEVTFLPLQQEFFR